MNDLNLNDVVAYQPIARKELLELLEQLEKAQKRVEELERIPCWMEDHNHIHGDYPTPDRIRSHFNICCTKLSPEDQVHFAGMLANPPESNNALKRAFDLRAQLSINPKE